MYTPIALIHKGIPNRIPIPRSPVMKRKHPGRRASPSRMPQRRIRGDISPSFVTLAENNDFPEPIIEDDLKGIRGWRHLTRGALISSEDLYQNRVSHFWPALSSEPIWHWCKPLCSLFPCRDVARFPGAFWTTLKAIIQGIIISLINAFRAFLGENPTRMINHRPFFSSHRKIQRVLLKTITLANPRASGNEVNNLREKMSATFRRLLSYQLRQIQRTQKSREWSFVSCLRGNQSPWYFRHTMLRRASNGSKKWLNMYGENSMGVHGMCRLRN